MVASAVIGTALIGCGSNNGNSGSNNTSSDIAESAETTSSETETKAADQVLNLVLAPNVSTLDSNAYGWVQEGQIISSVQEPLLRRTLDENGNGKL